MQQLHLPDEVAKSALRVSISDLTKEEEIDKFIEVCRRATRDNIYNLIFNNSKENKNV